MNPAAAASRVGLNRFTLNGAVYIGAIGCIVGYGHEARMRNKALTAHSRLNIKYERSLHDYRDLRKMYKETARDRNVWQKKATMLEKQIYKDDVKELKRIEMMEAATLEKQIANGEDHTIEDVDGTEETMVKPSFARRNWGWKR